MRKRLIRHKPLVVDGLSYEASLTADIANDVVHLRVTYRAAYGTRSFVTIVGLTNYEYFTHYGFADREGFSPEAETVEITPRALTELIRYSLDHGWSPESEKSNKRIEITNLELRGLLGAAFDRGGDPEAGK